MIGSFDEFPGFQLIDHASDRAEAHSQSRGQVAHCAWSLKVEKPEAIGLRNSQRAVQSLVEASELVERGDTVENIGQPGHILVESHGDILRYPYNTKTEVKVG